MMSFHLFLVMCNESIAREVGGQIPSQLNASGPLSNLFLLLTHVESVDRGQGGIIFLTHLIDGICVKVRFPAS